MSKRLGSSLKFFFRCFRTNRNFCLHKFPPRFTQLVEDFLRGFATASPDTPFPRYINVRDKLPCPQITSNERENIYSELATKKESARALQKRRKAAVEDRNSLLERQRAGRKNAELVEKIEFLFRDRLKDPWRFEDEDWKSAAQAAMLGMVGYSRGNVKDLAAAFDRFGEAIGVDPPAVVEEVAEEKSGEEKGNRAAEDKEPDSKRRRVGSEERSGPGEEERKKEPPALARQISGTLEDPHIQREIQTAFINIKASLRHDRKTLLFAFLRRHFGAASPDASNLEKVYEAMRGPSSKVKQESCFVVPASTRRDVFSPRYLHQIFSKHSAMNIIAMNIVHEGTPPTSKLVHRGQTFLPEEKFVRDVLLHHPSECSDTYLTNNIISLLVPTQGLQ